jgi:hypothetical protein
MILFYSCTNYSFNENKDVIVNNIQFKKIKYYMDYVN